MANDAAGTFTSVAGLPSPGEDLDRLPASSIGDFDGDGRLDFVAGVQDPGVGPFAQPVFMGTHLYLDTPTGFVDAGLATSSSLFPYSLEVNLAVDVDGDGDRDFVTDTSGGQLDLQRAGPGLTFTTEFLFDDFGSVAADSLHLLDADADGDLDLLFAREFTTQLIDLLENDGAGGYTSAAVMSTDYIQGTSDGDFLFTAMDDVNGDGLLDVLATPQDETFLTPRATAVFLANGPGLTFDPLRLYTGSVGGTFGDADADGDLDALGRGFVESRRYDTVTAGEIQQLGVGTDGAGGVVPLLGATGPLRPGSTTAALRASLAVGGAPMIFVHSQTLTVQPDVPFPGATLFVAPPFAVDVATAGGPAGAPGEGHLALSFPPTFLVNAAGKTLYVQGAALDLAAPGFLALTNGLRLTFGL